MPLSINVGLSRKASKDYQSTGVSINVTAELDSALLLKPGELQQQIDSLYTQAEQAIDRQVKAYAGTNTPQTNAPSNTGSNERSRRTAPQNGRTRSNSNGNGTGNGNGHGAASGMTESQRRAINAIAERMNVDAGQEAQDLFGTALNDLSIRQASELIDHLKTLMRPTECCLMRPSDILQDDPDCWLYVPGRDVDAIHGDHKTSHHGRVRAIPLNRRCMEILKPFMHRAAKKYLFSPAEAMQEYLRLKHADRVTPMNQGNKPKPDPLIKAGEHYTTDSLREAIVRACKRAGVAAFSPYDLRRTSATRIRRLLGKDAACTMLGHAESTTTDIYLLDEVQEAMRVAKQLVPSPKPPSAENLRKEDPKPV